jgi:hypothetical protein
MAYVVSEKIPAVPAIRLTLTWVQHLFQTGNAPLHTPFDERLDRYRFYGRFPFESAATIDRGNLHFCPMRFQVSGAFKARILDDSSVIIVAQNSFLDRACAGQIK